MKNLRNSKAVPLPVIMEGASPALLKSEALKLAAGWFEGGGSHKVSAGLHVDVAVLDNGADAVIKVEDIRAIRRDALLRPFDGEVKVYIIAHAHKLNQNAQNALLKILEEPPPYVRFILLTQNATLLLQTIRSRCRVQLTTNNEQRTVSGERERAEAFVAALDEPWGRAGVAFSWERLSRDAMRGVLGEVLEVLRDRCVRDGVKPSYIKAINTVTALLPSLEQNASVGTVCGVIAIT